MKAEKKDIDLNTDSKLEDEPEPSEDDSDKDDNRGTPGKHPGVSGQEIKKPPKKRFEYKLISDSLSKFVQVYEKSIEVRESNENARMANLVAAITSFANASSSQNSIHSDPDVEVVKETKGKGFPQTTTTTIDGEYKFYYILFNDL